MAFGHALWVSTMVAELAGIWYPTWEVAGIWDSGNGIFLPKSLIPGSLLDMSPCVLINGSVVVVEWFFSTRTVWSFWAVPRYIDIDRTEKERVREIEKERENEMVKKAAFVSTELFKGETLH